MNRGSRHATGESFLVLSTSSGFRPMEEDALIGLPVPAAHREL